MKTKSKKLTNLDDLIEQAADQIIKDTQRWVVAGHFTKVIRRSHLKAIVRSVLKIFGPYIRFAD